MSVTGRNLKGDIVTVPSCPNCGGWVFAPSPGRAWCMKHYADGGCGADNLAKRKR